MKKTDILLVLPFLLFSCNKSENKIPIYHVRSINYKEEKNYHLLYEMDESLLLSLKQKEASFFVCIYQESCSSGCSVFDYSLYSKANEDDFLIPYIDKGKYDLLPKDQFPSVHENAILFFEKGNLCNQIEITEENVSIKAVSQIIDKYTYDTDVDIVSPIQKNRSSVLDSFSFTTEKNVSDTYYRSYLDSMKKPTLLVDTKKIEDYTKIQERKDYSSLYFYPGTDSLTETFFQKTSTEKEELENNPSYLLD